MLAPFLFGSYGTPELTLLTVGMANKSKSKSPKSTKTKPKKVGGRKEKYTPEMVQEVEKIVLVTGSISEAYKAVGVGKTTFFRWINEKPDLREAVSRAHTDRKTFIERGFLPQMKRALIGIDEALVGRKITLKRKTTKSHYDGETQKRIKILEVSETEYESYIRPDMKAIEKVLGPNALRNNVYIRAIEDNLTNGESELYKLVFGDLSMNEEAEQFEGIYVLRLQLDQLKIRYMEAHIQREYDNGNITMDQWVEFTDKLRKSYAQISDRMETRAQKMLGGYSYQEILLQVEQVWKTVVETFDEALSTTYEREGKKQPYTVPPDVQKKIMEKAVGMIRDRSDDALLVLQNAPMKQ